MPEEIKFYRYTISVRACLDMETDTATGEEVYLLLTTYNLHHETQKGYWIKYEWDTEPYKWISKTAKKRFACLTQAEALNNYILRSKKRLEILNNLISRTQTGLYLAEREIVLIRKVKDG